MLPTDPRNLSNQTFGNLTVLPTYRYVLSGGRRRIEWLVICRCGSTRYMKRDALLNKRPSVHGCGDCKNVLHGMCDTPEYVVWVNFMQRCYNKNNESYENYGGRGITVDPHWHIFINFYNDMGKRPTNEHSIDRVNNYDGYNKANCVWATKFEQNKNRRSN